MRTKQFQQVLFEVARKAGFSPESSNFLSNQAIPMAEYISQWVSRLYPSLDWPEWTHVHEFTPNPATHVVTWDANDIETNALMKLNRILSVYPVDPRTMNPPIGFRFTLREEGIHCGFEHGTNVWIKYIDPAPVYTAVVWDSNHTYAQGDSVYAVTSGECYLSRTSGNIGHDPGMAFEQAITTALTQQYAPGTPGQPGQPKIVDVNMDQLLPAPPTGPVTGPPAPFIADPPPANSVFAIEVDGPPTNGSGPVLGTASHTATGSESLVTIANALVATLTPLLTGFTLSVNSTAKTLRLSDMSGFVIGSATYEPPGGAINYQLNRTQIQTYIPAVPPVPPTPEKIVMTLGTGQVDTSYIYNLAFFDNQGGEHDVSYTPLATDGGPDILAGIAYQINHSTDPFFMGMACAIDTVGLSITFSLFGIFSLTAELDSVSGPWWLFVPFPDALAQQVIRGATADFLAEWGQSDKSAVVEQAVPGETAITAGKFTSSPISPLTSQEKPFSRYKLNP